MERRRDSKRTNSQHSRHLRAVPHGDVKRLDTLQIGKAAELRFCSLAILGSSGQLELVPPLADDERRDFEIHRRHGFGRPLSLQVRSQTRRYGDSLMIRFYKGPQHPVDPAFWFLAGQIDLEAMDFADPLFLIPSTALRRKGHVILAARLIMTNPPKSRWTPFRVTRRQLGARLLYIVDSLNSRLPGLI